MMFNHIILGILATVSTTQSYADTASPDQISAVKEQACDAAQRVDQNQKRLDREKEYLKEGGVADKENMYRASRGIVEGRRELKAAMKEYQDLTGKTYGESDIRACYYFSN